ncbi:MAG: DUF177 domain-containing protein [Gammaproteobacteria bacterium]|nr:DUF177 domain-containing protein [Gammaproteobacteria bacterium]
MTTAQLPVYVNVRQVFSQEAEIGGTVSLDRMLCFRQLLASDRASIHANLSFAKARSGHREISGEVSATADMLCQRCLQPVQLNIRDSIRLALLESEDQMVDLDPEWDPWICDGLRLPLAKLVEEQLMLALPIVNVCEDEACIVKLEYRPAPESDLNFLNQKVATTKPFATLGKLMKNTR